MHKVQIDSNVVSFLTYQKSDKAEIDTKKELAKVAGVSHDTIRKVETIEARTFIQGELTRGGVDV